MGVDYDDMVMTIEKIRKNMKIILKLYHTSDKDKREPLEKLNKLHYGI